MRPEFSPQREPGQYPAPIYAEWKGGLKRIVAVLDIQDSGDLYLRDVITGTNPPDPFTDEELALIWLEVYLDRPPEYTMEDGLSEVLDRWGDKQWFLDCSVCNDAAGDRIQIEVEECLYVDDEIPRYIGELGKDAIFIVVMLRDTGAVVCELLDEELLS